MQRERQGRFFFFFLTAIKYEEAFVGEVFFFLLESLSSLIKKFNVNRDPRGII